MCSIAAQQAGYGAAITTAFAASGGYAADAAACDPLLLPVGQFTAKRMLCTASAGDTAVNTVVATAGNHGDVSNWPTGIPTQMLAHLNG